MIDGLVEHLEAHHGDIVDDWGTDPDGDERPFRFVHQAGTARKLLPVQRLSMPAPRRAEACRARSSHECGPWTARISRAITPPSLSGYARGWRYGTSEVVVRSPARVDKRA